MPQQLFGAYEATRKRKESLTEGGAEGLTDPGYLVAQRSKYLPPELFGEKSQQTQTITT